MPHITQFEWLSLLALALAVAAAWWRGTRADRRSALIIAAAWLASMLVDDDGSRGVQWGIFAIDLLLVSYLLVEGVFGRRLWPVCAAVAQLFIVMTHVAFLMSPSMIHEGFFSAYYLWSYVVLLCLLVGALTNRRGRNA